MAGKESGWLTTGQAAKLSSVTPDTILKWIRKGRLNGVRTVGGHHRIQRQDLEQLAPRAEVADKFSPQSRQCFNQPLHCWEYLGNRGVVTDGCKPCVVYRTRATRCFEMAQLEGEVGHAMQFCQTSCQDCAYYRRVKGMATNVLVVSSDRRLTERLTGEAVKSLSFRFARNAYETSTIIAEFHPAFTVLDQEMLGGEISNLVDCLARDPRVPGLRIILAVPRATPSHEKKELLRGLVVSAIEKPFGQSQIADVVKSFPVELLASENNRT